MRTCAQLLKRGHLYESSSRPRSARGGEGARARSGRANTAARARPRRARDEFVTFRAVWGCAVEHAGRRYDRSSIPNAKCTLRIELGSASGVRARAAAPKRPRARPRRARDEFVTFRAVRSCACWACGPMIRPGIDIEREVRATSRARARARRAATRRARARSGRANAAARADRCGRARWPPLPDGTPQSWGLSSMSSRASFDDLARACEHAGDEVPTCAHAEHRSRAHRARPRRLRRDPSIAPLLVGVRGGASSIPIATSAQPESSRVRIMRPGPSARRESPYGPGRTTRMMRNWSRGPGDAESAWDRYPIRRGEGG